MTRLLFGITAGALVTYALACAALFFMQRSLLYFPQAKPQGSAANSLRLAVEGAQLELTVRRLAGEKALVYFGGNAEDVSASLRSLSQAFPEHAIFLMNYRGYGSSTGKPSEPALHADALVLFDHVAVKHKNVTVMGASLGSGVAVRLASARPVERLILVTPYNSILEVAAAKFRLFPVALLLQDRFESWRYAPLVTAPTRVLMAEFDEMIPAASTQRLLAAFKPGVATLATIKQTSHNTITQSTAYLDALTGKNN